MSWPNWNSPWSTGQAVSAATTAAIAPAAAVATALPTPGTIPVNPAQYTAEQWATMQQQNWQQWVQWQQQYQQWQQQYGEQYQKSLSALSAQTTLPAAPVVPAVVPQQPIATPVQPPLPAAFGTQPPLPFSTNVAPPPLPPDSKPPPPPEQSQQTNQTTMPPSYNYTQPPPNMNTQPLTFNKPPPNQFSQPPPPVAPPPPITTSTTSTTNSNATQSFTANTSKPPPSLLSLRVDKPTFDTSVPASSPQNKRKFNDTNRFNENVIPEKSPRTSGTWNNTPSSQPDQRSDTNVQSQPPAQTQPSKPPKKPINPNEITEAERKFDEQFKAWEEQFNKWKEQNANHPDKQQYKEYEAKWEAWRNQLLERREQMRRKRMGLAVPKTSTKITPPVIPAVQSNDLVQKKPQPQETAPVQPTPTVVEPEKPKEHLETKPLSQPQKLQQPQQPSGDPKTDFYNEPPKEQRQRRNRRLNDATVTTEAPNSAAEETTTNVEQSNTSSSSYEFMSKNDASGIPGLDLVDETKTETKPPEDIEKKSGPDLSAISRGIDSILGDQNLANIISLVSQQKQNDQNVDQNDRNNSNLSENVPSVTERPNDSKFIRNSQIKILDNRPYQPPFDSQNQMDRPPYQETNLHSSFGSQQRPPFDGPQSQFNQRPPFDNQRNSFDGQNQFDNQRGSSFDNQRGPPFDNQQRPPFDNQRGPPFDNQQRPPFDNQQRPPFDNQQRPPFDNQRGPPFDNQRSSFDNPKPLFDNAPRSLFDNQRGPPFDNQQRSQFDNQRGGPPFDNQRGSQFDNQRGSQFDNQRGSQFDNQRGPPFDNQQRPPFDNQRGPPFDNQQRSSFDNQRGPPFDNQRGPSFDNQRGPPFDNKRGSQFDNQRGPPFDNQRGGSEFDNQRGPSFDNQRPPFDNQRGPPFDNQRPPFDNNQRGPPFDNQRPPFDNQRGPSSFDDRNRGPNDNRFSNDRPPFDRFGPRNDDGNSDNRFGASNQQRFDNKPPALLDLPMVKPVTDPWARPPSILDRDNQNRPPFGNENFNRPPPFGDNMNRPPPPFGDNMNRPPPPFGDNMNRPPPPFGDNLNRPPPFNDSTNIDKDRPFNENQSANLGDTNKPAVGVGDENIPKNEDTNSKSEWEGDILAPATIIDYEHKSLAQRDEDAVFIEPVETIDYEHKSKNIPINEPIKPSWSNQQSKYGNDKPYSSRGDNYQSGDFRGNWKNNPPYEGYKRDEPPPRDYPPHRASYGGGGGNSNDKHNTSGYDRRYSGGNRSRSYDESSMSPKDRFDRRSSYHYDKRNQESSDKMSNPLPPPPEISSERRVESLFPSVADDSNLQANVPVSKLEKETEKHLPVQNMTLIEDLLSMPGRANRPPRIVIILRGPPGSGKTFLAKLIKDKEVSQGGSAPRILSLDDYFMVEVEKDSTDPDTGRKIKTKEMVYEYEQCMETAYLSSLVKAFKKTITDGFFSFIIVDCVNNKVKQYEEMWSFAKQNGFQVYVCQMELDVAACTKRNIHGRTEDQIKELVDDWEPTPSHHLMLDATSLLQAACISEVEMDEVSDDDNLQDLDSPKDNDDDEQTADEAVGYKSKWETMEHTFDKLARLDGISKPLRHSTQSMEDYLQLDDEWKEPEAKPGQKRVRWADLVERREQEKMRAIGFVVGQTDWNRMMDPSQGSSALTQTKFIEPIRKY